MVCCHQPDFVDMMPQEIHAFSNASQNDINVAVYLKSLNKSNHVTVSLIHGHTIVTPLQATSIPWLGLCGVALAAQAVVKM